jgi:hypothetical protein
MKKANDLQVGGDHYKSKKIQPWEAMEAWMNQDEFRGFLRGNAIKYLAREKGNDKVTDIKKAMHYMKKLLETYEEPDNVSE